MTNTVGWNLRDDHVSPSGLYHTEDRHRLSTTLEDTVRETRAALYVENRVEWTPWLRTIAGLRAERTSFSVGSNIVENSGSGAAAIALPKLSVILGPWRRTEFFVNAGEGYHSNDVRGATERIDPSTRDGVDPVTPLVRAVGGELGIRTERIPRLQSSLSLWYLHLASELVFDGDAGTTTPGRPSRRLGVEWSSHYAASRWLLVDLDVATTSARFTDDAAVGNHIPEALQSTAAAGVTLHAIGPWTAALFLRYFGPRSLVESDSVRSTSTTLFNAQTTYDVSRKIRIRLDVFNLLNQKSDDIAYYYTSRLRGEPAGGITDLHFHPVESRAIRLGVVALF
jgi:outer membrane receptor protein involved in Fe transport